MASAVAQLWVAQGVISSGTGYLLRAQFDAPPGELDPELRPRGAARAAGVAANECASAPRGQRFDWRNGAKDPGRDFGRRARAEELVQLRDSQCSKTTAQELAAALKGD